VLTQPRLTPPSRVSLAIILPDDNTVAIFRHLCFALRMADPDLPEVYKNPSVAYFPANGGPTAFDRSVFSPLLPVLTILERREASGRESDSIVESILSGRNDFTLVTSKATFFNYLSPHAIEATLGVRIDVTDQADVPLLVAQALRAKEGGGWESLTANEQRRRIGYAANALAESIAPSMTPELLLERRAKGDVGRWLDAIKRLIPS